MFEIEKIQNIQTKGAAEQEYIVFEVKVEGFEHLYEVQVEEDCRIFFLKHKNKFREVCPLCNMSGRADSLKCHITFFNKHKLNQMLLERFELKFPLLLINNKST